jgi:hypothetical protein
MEHKLPPLYIICHGICINKLKKDNIILTDLKKYNIFLINTKLSVDDLKKYVNLCVIHLCLSRKEGYGHYINEARLNKNLVITIDGEPMNELINNNTGFLIPYNNKKLNQWNLSNEYSFSPDVLVECIIKILNTDKKLLQNKINNAYNEYIKDTDNFIENMKRHKLQIFDV